MAKKIQVKNGQSMLDLAVQHTGSVESAIELATVNEMSITDDITVDAIDPVGVVNRRITYHYQYNKIKPATSVSEKGQIFEDIFKEIFR